MPSYCEQCSYTIIEMMMHGLPIIGATSPGLSEMVENPFAKFEIIQGDKNINTNSEKLAKCIMFNIYNQNHSDNIREFFLKKYTLNRVIEEMIKVYEL